MLPHSVIRPCLVGLVFLEECVEVIVFDESVFPRGRLGLIRWLFKSVVFS